MATFRFALQSVLGHRALLERHKQRAVAAVEGERAGLEATLRDCARRSDQRRLERRALLGGVVDVRAVRLQAAASLSLDARARQTALALAGVHQRLVRARRELLEASRRRRAVELLRERRYEEWRLEQSRREDASLDELAVIGASARGAAL